MSSARRRAGARHIHERISQRCQRRVRGGGGGTQLIGARRGDKAALLQHDDVLHKILNVINLVRRDNDCGAIPHVEIEQSVPERSPHHCIHTQLNLVQKQDWAVARQSEDCIER